VRKDVWVVNFRPLQPRRLVKRVGHCVCVRVGGWWFGYRVGPWLSEHQGSRGSHIGTGARHSSRTNDMQMNDPTNVTKNKLVHAQGPTYHVQPLITNSSCMVPVFSIGRLQTAGKGSPLRRSFQLANCSQASWMQKRSEPTRNA